MGPPPIEELDRQVAEAFGDTFIHSTMSQARPQPQTQAQIVVKHAERPCAHHIPTSLAAKLPVPHLCSTCTINADIKAIQDVQQRFADRGSAFVSKQMAHHKTVRKRWRTAKLALIKTVTFFEALIADSHWSSEDAVKVKAALDVWNKKKLVLTKVPGVNYVPSAEEDGPIEEEHEIARLMVDLLKLVLAKEMAGEDKDWCRQR